MILVVCEGEKTEPQYIQGFASACKNPRVEVRIAPEHGVPRYLVQVAKQHKKAAESRAASLRDTNLAYDQVWCVFDIDEHPHIDDARQMARDNGINLAVSNPCFELWLLLHFREQPGTQHRHDVGRMLREFVPGFDKSVQYPHYAHGYDAAVRRARKLVVLAESVEDLGRNPSTDVHLLTESIRLD